MKLIQITDCHIKKNNDDLIYGVNPRERLTEIIKYIKINQKEFDFILLTGDISDDGSIESYKFVADLFISLSKEIYFINGNHDCKNNMLSVFSNYDLFHHLQDFQYKSWIFIGVDSSVKAKDYGFISDIELNKLNISLIKSEKSNNNVAVVTHHHPVSVHTPLIDDCLIKNGPDFIKAIENHNVVKLIITGHVHNDYSINIEKIKLETGPATCVQFIAGGSNENTDIDKIKYGYKIYNLEENGTYYTTTVYL